MHLPKDQIAGMAHRIGIGEALQGGPDDLMRVTLGSCVGLCLVSTREPKFALAHVLLPSVGDSIESNSREKSRFADTVVPHLIEMLEVAGRQRRTLRAFIAGGASMFGGSGQRSHVGSENAAALNQALKAHGITVSAADLGGSDGRQLIVDAGRGRVFTIRFGDEEGSDGCEWELPHVFRTSSLGSAEARSGEQR